MWKQVFLLLTHRLINLCILLLMGKILKSCSLFYFILFSLLMGCYGFLDHTKFILYDKKYSLECEVQVVYIIRIILAFL